MRVSLTFQKLCEIKNWQFKPYEDKLRIAHASIQKALAQSKRQAVAFSGGKNSLVVLHLVLRYKPDVIVTFNNTGVEYPETVRYVHKIAKEWNLNFYELRPKWTFWQVMKRYGFPRASRSWESSKKYGAGIVEPMCCKLLKVEPVANFYNTKHIDCYFTGITAFESRGRKFRIAKHGLICKVRYVGHSSQLNRPTLAVYPIGLWTELDVWTYIEENNLPVNPAYEKYGIERTGCMYCTSYIGWQRYLASNYPKVYKKILRMVGQSNLGDFMVI